MQYILIECCRRGNRILFLGPVIGFDRGKKVLNSLGGQPTLMEEPKIKRKQSFSNGSLVATTKILRDIAGIS